MLKFKLNTNYRFAPDGREAFVSLASVLNDFLLKEMNKYSDTFSVLKLSPTGNVEWIKMSCGQVIGPGDIPELRSANANYLISYEDAYCFEEVVEKADEKKYDVMTAVKGLGEGFLVRQTELTYDEAVEWASQYVKENDDEYCYIIQRFAQIELEMKPSVKINNL